MAKEDSSIRVRLMKIELDSGIYYRDESVEMMGETRPIVCKEHPMYKGRCDGADIVVTELLFCTSVKNSKECPRRRLINRGYIGGEEQNETNP